MDMHGTRTAREVEACLLSRCALAAAGGSLAADLVEASVFLLAANLVRSRKPAAADELRAAGNAYFQGNQGEPLTTAEILKRGLVGDMPRLRDGLLRKLEQSAA